MKKKTEKPLGARSTAARVSHSRRSNCLQPLYPRPDPDALPVLPFHTVCRLAARFRTDSSERREYRTHAGNVRTHV